MAAPETVSMRTRDGVRLDADVYSPQASGRYPVLLMRQPYGRRIASTVTYAHPAWYAAQGYIVVIQDVRGRGSSEGGFDPLAHERDDGRDTLDWAAGLPGCDGSIGMYGFSYQGATQLLAAASGHPALKTICPAMCAWDLYADWAHEGGAPRLALNLGWAAQIAAETARRGADHERYAALYAAGHAPGDDLLIDACGPRVRELLAGSHYADWLDQPRGSDYWKRRSPGTGFIAPSAPGAPLAAPDASGPATTAPSLPALHIGGWFDFFLTGTLAAFEHFRAGPALQRLVIGPWFHLPWSRSLGGVRLPESAQPRIDALQLRWFDHHLKGVDNGVDREAAVQLYDLGSGAWHQLKSYPQVQDLRLQLASDGRASLDVEAGRLEAAGPTSAPGGAGPTSAPGGAGATSAPGGAGATSAPGSAGASPITTTALPIDIIVHDPWRSVPTVGGHLPPSMGMQERGEVDERGDVATYTTAPLARALQLIGPVSCVLQADADTPGFDIAAVLGVIDAQGRVRNLTQGYLRCAAAGAQQVPLRHVCARIAPGERLRLSISAASYPGYAMHPGRAIAPGAARAADHSIITVRLDPAGSSLSLPRFMPDA